MIQSYESLQKDLGIQPDIAVLFDVGWFAERAPEVQQRILAGARRREFRKGQPIYRAGDGADGLYGLIDGVIEITVPGDDGVEIQIHRADTGFWIGDLALFAEEPRLVSVTAVSDISTLFVPQSFMRDLIKNDMGMLREFYALTHRNFATAFRLLANLSVSQSERRLGLRLLHYSELSTEPDGWLSLSQEDLARLIAVSLPTLQRILRRFVEDGLVEIGYRRLRVLDHPALAARCRD
ncbi:MAG: Crp/Fnr family transcriptional regulator [Mangrovicoccus sp.]|nr:Crp/Fnr family transcriptional regulator [Mangrovicoccus sp.]